MTQYQGKLISDLQHMVDKATACENTVGVQYWDPGTGEPCGRDGVLREEYDMVMCDKCFQQYSKPLCQLCGKTLGEHGAKGLHCPSTEPHELFHKTNRWTE
jgi:hypothetical protein